MACLDLEIDDDERGISYEGLNQQAQVEIPSGIDWEKAQLTISKSYSELFDHKYIIDPLDEG